MLDFLLASIIWTTCANQYGIGEPNNQCVYEGTRMMRIGDGEEWSYKEVYGGLSGYQCRKEVFPPKTFKSNKLFCQYSNEMIFEEVVRETEFLPKGDIGSSTKNIVPTKNYGRINSHVGAFRNKCTVSHFSYNDPLVFPGEEGASHLHIFFGNTSVNHNTKLEDISKTGNSTCTGGIVNRSSYWKPAVINKNTGIPLVPHSSINYYKEGYAGLKGKTFPNLPNGLGMITDDAYWTCEGSHKRFYDSFPVDCHNRMTAHVAFKQCWDGINLYNPSNSHVTNVDGKLKECPKSHPYKLPKITMTVRYNFNNIDDLILSSDVQHNGHTHSNMINSKPGGSLHGDIILGWDTEISQNFIDNCLNNQVDCHANLLGNGEMLK